MRPPPTLNGRAVSSLGGGGEGDWDKGGVAVFETPPHPEWKGRVLMVNCHHPPPHPQCRAPCMQVNWGHWGGGGWGGEALETPPHPEWKGHILIGEGIRGRGGAALETPPP